MTPISTYTEDFLVQQTTAEYLKQKLDWKSMYAYNNEDFGLDSLLGRASDREVVLTRYLRTQLEGQSQQPESQPESIEVRVLNLLAKTPLSKSDISKGLGQKSVSGQLNKVVRHLLDKGIIAYTLPGKPTSRFQKYTITAKGRTMLDSLRKSQ